MTLNQLASKIAKREGKKSQARIGDIREIIKIIVEIEAEVLASQEDSGLANAIEKRRDKIIKKKK